MIMMMPTRTTPTRAAITALLLPFVALSAQSVPSAQEAGLQSLLTDRPLLHVARFQHAPQLDGGLNDSEWADAQVATPFWHFQTGAQSKHDTWAKIGLDEEDLYIAFRCAEAEMPKLTFGPLPPDSMSLFARDHVELFLMPDALKPTFYHFSVDVAGNRHEERGSDGSWGCDWEAAVHREAGAWSVEMRIPRAKIGLDTPRLSLVNFCRTRRLEPQETSAWSKTFGVFHNPTRFGRLVYGPPSDVRFAAVSLRQPRAGENQVEVSVAGVKEPALVRVRGYVLRGNELSPFGARELRLREGDESSVSLPLRVERDAKARVAVVLERDGRVLTFCDAAEVSLSGAKATPIRKVLEPAAAPFMQWIDTDRLRGISYGFGFTGAMPDGDLTKADAPGGATRETLHLRGESYFKVLVEESEEIRFDVAAAAGDSPFTSSTYAVFGPEGKLLGKGLVEAGATCGVRVPTETAGMHTVLINSGPASWNPFSITLRNTHWVLDARGKSTYVHTPVSLHSLRDCKLAGFNVALVAAWQWGIPFADEEGLATLNDMLERLCQAAQDAGIKLIPYFGWGCAKTESAAGGDHVRALTRLSVRGPHPCPVSREYWERTFLRRAMLVAQLSKKYPCVLGIGLDPESYYFGNWYNEHLESAEEKGRAGAIYQPYGSSREKCVCDECLHGLLKSKGLPDPNLPEDGNVRFDWIAKEGLLDDLCAYQQAQLEATTQIVRARVQAVNPSLCFAGLLLTCADNWFCRGLSRGLGTSRVPALDFDETTYTSGYSTDAVQTRLDRYEQWNAHVVHGGCLWGLKHPPHNPHFLAAQMYNFALYGHGYWFWPGSMSVWRSADEVAGYYSLSGYPEDYWKSFVVANQEIDKRLANPDTYRSPLDRLEERPTIPEQPKERNEWAEKPCYPVHMYPGTRLSFIVPAGRKSVRVEWGYRETLGDRTLLVSVAGTEHHLSATVEAEKANRAELDVPEGGCAGWVELLGEAGGCVGVKLEGAKPFFGGGGGVKLR